MASKEFAELLTNAISGDYSSLEKIIDLYMPLIDKSSIVDGQFDITTPHGTSNGDQNRTMD